MSTNIDELKQLVNKENKFLTTKKKHTGFKILYVREYVKEWLFVSCNTDCNNITFIDCMANAGVYSDYDLCTAVEVLKLFCEFALKYPHKNFNVLFNDYDPDKVRICKIVCNLEINNMPINVHKYFDNLDVNDYIKVIKTKYNLFDYPSRTILYVDPYDFRTVFLPNLRIFLQTTYCELIFNMFTSDFVRNGVDSGIAKSLGGKFTFKSKEELWEYVTKYLSVGKMKHCLSYPFRNSKNVELYQILFLTPSSKGLDKLKQAIWDTFDGQEYYKTENSHEGQISFFDDSDNKDYKAKQYAAEAFNFLADKYRNKIIDYSLIESFVLSHSLLMSSQIISYIIKPKINEGQIIKQNLIKKNNYKQDSYLIIGKNNGNNN